MALEITHRNSINPDVKSALDLQKKLQREQHLVDAEYFAQQVIALREEIEAQKMNNPSVSLPNKIHTILALKNSNPGSEVPVNELPDKRNTLIALETMLLYSAACSLGQNIEQLPELVILEVKHSESQNCQVCLSNPLSLDIGSKKRSPKNFKLTAEKLEKPLVSPPVIF